MPYVDGTVWRGVPVYELPAFAGEGGRLYQTAGTATTRFLYDGADMIAEVNTSGTVLRRYVHGPGADEPLVWYEGAGTATRKWLVTDARGSIAAVTDASGDAETINTYDPYGVPGSSNAGRFQYTGQMFIADDGVDLYYYKARFYLPEIGRFLQTDPIGYGDGMNMYAYVGNDPVNGVDPSGMANGCVSIDGGTSVCRELLSYPYDGGQSFYTWYWADVDMTDNGPFDPAHPCDYYECGQIAREEAAGAGNSKRGDEDEVEDVPECNQTLVSAGNFLRVTGNGTAKAGAATTLFGIAWLASSARSGRIFNTRGLAAAPGGVAIIFGLGMVSGGGYENLAGQAIHASQGIDVQAFKTNATLAVITGVIGAGASPAVGLFSGGLESGAVLVSPPPQTEVRRCNLDAK